MKSYSWLIIVLLGCFLDAFSQGSKKTYTLFGQVLDDQGTGLPYVSVGVFNAKDSSYAKGVATEMNGKFSMQVPSGTYYAKISFLSFEEKIVSNIVITDKDVDLNKIKMVPSIKNLEEFEVVEERKLMELDLDKRVFNVDKDITNQGANATEILDNVPSVAVDVDGNVSLRGSQNVRILINGKPSGMTGISTSEALKQLQGSQIEKIEVITNPSSRYDAEGEVGIINIILKQDKREGINGSVNVDFGYPSNYGGGFNLTIKRKNFSVFTGYATNYRESPGSRISNQQFTYPDTSFRYDSKTTMDRVEKNHNLRLGTEVFLNQYNSFTISGNYNVGDGDNENNVSYTDFDGTGELIQELKRQEIEDKDLGSHDVSLNYRKTFKKKDRLLTFDVQQSANKDNESSTISQTNNHVLEDNIEQRAYNNEGSINWLFQTDYVHPIKDGKIEAGLKANLREVTDDYAVEELDDSLGSWEYIPGFRNDMLYNENVSAAYLMLGKKVKKFSYQLGVRSEYTEMKTNLRTTNEVNNRTYLSFFPSAHLSYELKKENSLQMSYSRRIQRPRHWWLLPFFSFSDSRSTFSGNPNLLPEFTDAFEVGHLKYWGKASLLSSVYYRYTTGTMDWITFSDGDGVTQRMPVNLGITNAFGIEFSGSYELKKWWDLRGSFNFYREIIEGSFDGVRYGSDTWAWSTRLNSKWTIKKKVNLQSSFNYNAPQQSPQGSNKARYSLDAGFSFDLLKGNGTISFNVKDMFNTRKRRSTSYGDNFVSEQEMQWRSRYFRVSFTYRINQKKKRGGDRDYEDFDGGGMG
ncbi:MAG: TonB-dependent receptor [Vicingus serpentipes]|nr:TonB-dependent receptor [Vicingus serpentipes]